MKGGILSSEMVHDREELRGAATLDAGEQNCATLILNVRQAMQTLSPGDVLEVVAYDPSAHLDLRAWTRMTGHTYLGMTDHDQFATYYLRKEGD